MTEPREAGIFKSWTQVAGMLLAIVVLLIALCALFGVLVLMVLWIISLGGFNG